MSEFDDSLGFTDPNLAFGPELAGDGAASGSLPALTLSSGTVSAVGGASKSASLGTLTLAAASASASGRASASASLGTLALSAASATASGNESGVAALGTLTTTALAATASGQQTVVQSSGGIWGLFPAKGRDVTARASTGQWGLAVLSPIAHARGESATAAPLPGVRPARRGRAVAGSFRPLTRRAPLASARASARAVVAGASIDVSAARDRQDDDLIISMLATLADSEMELV